MSTIAKRLFLAFLLVVGLTSPVLAQNTSVRPGSGGSGGGTGLLTADADDGSIDAAQTNSNVNTLNMAFDGSVWRRITFGTAGSPSAQVTSIQGVSGMTAVDVNIVSGAGSGGTALSDDADFTDGTTSGTPIGGVAEAASPSTVTEGDFGWAAITLNRALKTSLYNAAGTSAFGTAGTAATPVLTVQGITSMTPLSVAGIMVGNLANDTSAATTNRVAMLPVITETSAPTRTNGRDAALSGTAGGAIRVMPTDAAGAALSLATAANQTTANTELGEIKNLLEASAAQDVAHDAADAGNPVKIGGRAYSGVPTAVSATNDRTDAWFNLNGAAGAFPVAHTVGGCTPASVISSSAVLETEIKATAGQLYLLSVTNLDATPVFVKVYNDTAANTDESDTPVWRFIAPTAGADGNGFMLPIPVGASFSTAITVRITTGIADNDTGALTANEVLLSSCYK